MNTKQDKRRVDDGVAAPPPPVQETEYNHLHVLGPLEWNSVEGSADTTAREDFEL